MTDPAAEGDYVTIARVVRSRGNRGEVAAEDLSDGAGRFSEGARFVLREPAGKRREVVLERSWYHQGRLILKFEGVDSIGDAQLLRGSELEVLADELGPPPEGEHYFADLIGSAVVDADSGDPIGRVEDVLEQGGPMLLQVRAEEREILVPFAKSICVDITPEKGTIRVRLPAGLAELNS